MISDFPIAQPIRVKDSPREHRLETLEDVRSFVNDALAALRYGGNSTLVLRSDIGGRRD